MTEYISKIQNNQSYSEYNFVKIAGYSSKEIISLIKKLDIYNNETNLILIDEFIFELYEDLKYVCSNYKFVEFIKKLFTPNTKVMTLSYNSIFNELLSYSTFDNEIYEYINFFELNDDEFKKIMTKYLNVKITDKSIPLDSQTKITLSDTNFNLANIILKKIINTINSNRHKAKKFDNKLTQSKLELIMMLSEKNNSCLGSLLYNFDDKNMDENYKFVTSKVDTNFDNENYKISKIYDEFINKTEIDFANDIKNIKHLSFVMVKLLILNNVFDNFTKILNIIYSRSNISVITLISILRFDLLDINLSLLKKIIYYGRYDVFKLLYFHISYKILPILKESNPLDFSDIIISYTNDIYGGSSWGNDECDRCIVGKKNHDKLIKLILSIGVEKKYTNICWTDEIKKCWIKIAISNNKYSNTTLDDEYFVSYNELIEILELKFDFTNKKSIKEHIDLCGRKSTWNIITSTCDDKFLDLLFD